MPTMMPYRPEHLQQARWLLQQTHAAGGLAPLDLDRFHADQAIAARDPFAPGIPQVACGIWPTGECVYDELGIKEDYWRYDHDEDWRLELNRAFNDRSEQILGRRVLSESRSDPALVWPQSRSLADLFEARNVWHDRSWWLMQSAHGEDELKSLLDRVEKRLENLRQFLLPPEWESQKSRLQAAGAKPPLYRGQRGPITFATSIYGAEDFLMLVLDCPELAARFRDTILKAMLAIGKLLDDEAGLTAETRCGSFAFFDDNCCLMTSQMYEFFGYPILKALFDYYCPRPEHWRYQHSDSAMGHLLPILARLNFGAVNFGPTVLADEIRRHMPRTRIDGQLAPFSLSRNEEENIVLEFLRDHEMTRETRGLNFATAGSVNNGSRLTGIRLVMSTIQHFGRFQ